MSREPGPAIDPFRDAARTFLKELVWRSPLGPRPTANLRPPVAVFASRRSGSTLMMQALAAGDRASFADQPFSLYTASRSAVNALPLAEYGQLIAPDEAEEALIRSYVDDLLAGRRVANGPWRFWTRSYPRRWDRLVLKVTDAKCMAPWLAETFGLKAVCMFRHPAAQSLSVTRNGWWTTGRAFLRNEQYRSQHLTPELTEHCWSVYREGTRFHQGVVDWCLENVPLLAAAHQHPEWSVVTYEGTVLEPEETARRLAGDCEVRNPTAVADALCTASLSTRRGSTSATRGRIRAADSEYLTERWMQEARPADVTDLGETLAAFDLRLYSADDPLPRLAETGL